MPTPYRPTGPAHRWSWVRVLLLLPFAALFWVPSYNTIEPAAFGVPVLFGLPLGHGKHLATLPLGVTCTLDADARTLTVDEAPVR